jgi:hypothetical protein
MVVNWKQGACIPAHGHVRGYMEEHLIFGRVKHRLYRIVDAINKVVRPIKVELFCESGATINAGFNEHFTEYGAHVHDFTFLEDSATLNLVPAHPRNATGNTFIVEEFMLKHVSFQLEKFIPISLEATLHLPPGEVFLARSATTKDIGDHFYVITSSPKQKKAGLRPVGEAIPASSDFSKLLDSIEPQDGDIRILRLMPEVRDLFLEWHGIQVKKTIVFPQP